MSAGVVRMAEAMEENFTRFCGELSEERKKRGKHPGHRRVARRQAAGVDGKERESGVGAVSGFRREENESNPTQSVSLASGSATAMRELCLGLGAACRVAGQHGAFPPGEPTRPKATHPQHQTCRQRSLASVSLRRVHATG